MLACVGFAVVTPDCVVKARMNAMGALTTGSARRSWPTMGGAAALSRPGWFTPASALEIPTAGIDGKDALKLSSAHGHPEGVLRGHAEHSSHTHRFTTSQVHLGALGDAQ